MSADPVGKRRARAGWRCVGWVHPWRRRGEPDVLTGPLSSADQLQHYYGSKAPLATVRIWRRGKRYAARVAAGWRLVGVRLDPEFWSKTLRPSNEAFSRHCARRYKQAGLPAPLWLVWRRRKGAA